MINKRGSNREGVTGSERAAAKLPEGMVSLVLTSQRPAIMNH